MKEITPNSLLMGGSAGHNIGRARGGSVERIVLFALQRNPNLRAGWGSGFPLLRGRCCAWQSVLSLSLIHI